MEKFSLTAKVSTTGGQSATSAPITVNVLPPPTISLLTLSNFALTGQTIDLIAQAGPGQGGTTTATLTQVEFFVDNGTSNTSIGTVTSPPYNLRWPNAPAGTLSFTAKVTDSDGFVTTSAPVAITVSSAMPSITIQSPANGASVPTGNVLVSGTFAGPANSGVNVNGVIATLNSNGSYFALVPVETGSNTLTATGTWSNSTSATASMTVAAQAQVPSTMRVTLNKTNGTAPFDVEFTIVNSGSTAGSFTLDGGASFVVPAAGYAFQTKTYTQIGANVATLALTDGMGQSVTKQFLIEVRDEAQTDRVLRATWANMNEALVAGDKAKAMNYLDPAAQVKYSPVIDVLMPNFPSIVGSYSAPAQMAIGENLGEYAVARTLGNTRRLFMIYFIRGSTGVWHVGSM